MEVNNSLIRKKNDIKTGRMTKVGSFIAANVSAKNFGSFKLPETVVSGFGTQIPSRLTVICGDNFWKAEYKSETGIIGGLRQFVIYYSIKMFYSVQFDYYGDDVLTAKIFNSNGLECTYDDTMKQKTVECDADEFILSRTKDEFENNKNVWKFAIAGKIEKYYTLTVSRHDIDRRTRSMVLNQELTSLFNKWTLWNTCTLVLCGKIWKIDVIRSGGRCLFGKGWLDFVKDCNVTVGDKLILFRYGVMGAKSLNTIIVKESDHTPVSDTGENLEKSFLKIISANILETGELVVPFLVKEVYASKLKKTKRINVIGNNWNVNYNEKNGSFGDLRDMIKSFKVLFNETIILKFTDGDEIIGRIYRLDGKEIDYVARLFNLQESKSTSWMWSLQWDDDEESDDETPMDATHQLDVTCIASTSGLRDSGHVLGKQSSEIIVIDKGRDTDTQFTKKLMRSHVDNRSHGVIIPIYLKPAGREWMAGDEVTFVTIKGSWKIRIVLSNGAAHFSSGWNSFIKDNDLKESDTLMFDMFEDNGKIEFMITIFT